MSSAQSPSPGDPPTYHHGITLTRRRTLQAIGAAAIAGTASSGTVAADNGLVDGLKEAIGGVIDKTHWTMAVFAMPVFVGLVGGTWYRNAMNEDPTSDRVQLHQLVTNEAAWMNNHSVNFGNYLNDTRPIASLEARHGMASEWELGNGSSKGYDTALSRIRQYYCVPEFNHLHVSNKALLQLSYIAGAGQNTDPAYNIQTIGERVSDGSNVIVRISDAREQTKPVLHEGTVVDENALDNVDNLDGDDGRFITPVFDFLDASDETLIGSKALGPDELDAWDSDHQLSVRGDGHTGATTFVLEDGTEVLTDLRLTTQNVSDDGGDLNSTDSLLAFDGREFFEILEEVRTLSDDVVAWYDQSFVEDIYAELDAGNITPEQVRSPEGMARFLSGTDDPTDERFQISWMQQFGFERPDLRLVRGMRVNWTGATDTWIDPDPNLDDRHAYPDEYVDGETYNGMLFGTEDVDFKSGNRYAVGSERFSRSDGGLAVIDQMGDPVRYHSPSGRVFGSPEHNIAIGESGGDVEAMNTTDGSVAWTGSYTHNGYNRWAGLSKNQDVFVVVDSPSGSDPAPAKTFDVETGDVLWSSTLADQGRQLSVTENYLAHLGTSSTDGLCIYDLYTGTEYVAESGDFYDNLHAAAETGSVVASGWDGTYKAYDTDTWEVLWTGSHSPNHAIGHDGVLYLANGTTLTALEADTGTEMWTYTASDSIVSLNVAQSADHLVLGASGTVRVSFDGDELATVGGLSPYWLRLPNESLDGVAARAIMFDESTRDEDGEVIEQGQGQVDLWDGVLEVVEMWDAEGADITHVDDGTISDIEALEGTPDSIDTIVEEMDEFDSVDDIRYTRDVLAIIEHYEVDATVGNDGDADVQTTEPDYTDQDYDAVTSAEFAEAMAELEELIAQLESENEETSSSTEDDEPLFGGLFGSFDGGSGTLLGFGLIAAVVLAVVGIVTDLLPWTR
ncbi:PQQ-binding-like beta-propeller repeat protein [Natronosalvus halobius]|uniref:outer membrane protein assembly factor BamB family protein n=1 Tax=Natronosalvus halobius TaxID=2953746 RepID=UPI00209D5BEB|nr:PQQ-binding-like beta-propeller repeat protein [Natronosalvus halobius]USZ71994.1 PQQ-binding-like beta-propeller repeat protein [Natronosalvus halobius]